MNKRKENFLWLMAISIFYATNISFAADWFAFRKDTNRTGATDKELSFPLVSQWASVQLDGDGYCHYSSPIISGEAIYMGSDQGKIFAFNRKTGVKNWEYATKGSIHSTPTVGNGFIYFGCSDGNLYSLSIQDGSMKWKYNLGSAVNSSPVVYNGYVYFGANNGHFYALNAQTGQESLIVNVGSYIWSSPAISNGVIYFGSYDNYLYAYDAFSGQLKWKYYCGYGGIRSTPAIDNNVLYITTYNKSSPGNLYAIDLLNSTNNNVFIKWTQKIGNGISIASSPSVMDGMVYVYTVGPSSNQVYLYAFSTLDGNCVWSQQVKAQLDPYLYPDISFDPYSSPVVTNDCVFVPEAYTVMALNRITGAVKWTSPVIKPSIQSSPATSNGWLYVYAGNQLYGFRSTDSTPPITTLNIKENLFCSQETFPNNTLGTWVTSLSTFTLSAKDTGSEVISTKYQIDGGDWRNYTGPFNLKSEGITGSNNHNILWYSADDFGNVESFNTLSLIYIDDTSPKTVFSDGTNFSQETSVVWTSASNALTVSPYNLYEGAPSRSFMWKEINSQDWNTYNYNWKAPKDNVSYQLLLTGGEDTFCYRSVDYLGQYEDTKLIKIDTTAPNTCILNLDGPMYLLGPMLYISSFTTFTLTSYDTGSGLKQIEYQLSSSEPWILYSKPFTIADERAISRNFFKGRSTDKVGNLSKEFYFNFKNSLFIIDKTPPVTKLSVKTPKNVVGNTTWISTSTLVVLSAADTRSGVKVIRYKIDGQDWQNYINNFTISMTGALTLYYYSADNVDNTETINTIALFVDADTISPVTAIQIGDSKTIIGSETHVYPATTFVLSAIDTLSGVKWIKYQTDNNVWKTYSGTFTFTSEQIDTVGLHTIKYQSQDNAGNTEGLKLITVILDSGTINDLMPPVTTLIPGLPSYYSFGNTYVSQMTSLALSAIDDKSGISYTKYQIDNGNLKSYTDSTTFDKEGVTVSCTHTISYYSADAAGNIEDSNVSVVQLDNEVPTTTLFVSTGKLYQEGDVTWCSSSPIFTLSDTDSISGSKLSRYSIDTNDWKTYQETTSFETEGIIPSGIHTFNYFSVDNVCNTEPVKNASIGIDNAPPKTLLSLSSYYENAGKVWVSSSTPISLTVQDTGSGVAGIKYRIGSGQENTYTQPFMILQEGQNVISFYSIDNLGNSENTNTFIVYVDASAPVSQISIGDVNYTRNSSIWVKSSTPINIVSYDTPGSGVKRIEYSIDNPGSWTAINGTFNLPISGTHTIYYRATDNVGNIETLIEEKVISSPDDWQQALSSDNVDIEASLGDVALTGIPPWTVAYECNELPGNADPHWTPINGGSYTEEINPAGFLHYSTADPSSYHGWSREIPEASDANGLTAEVRLRIENTNNYPWDIFIRLEDGSYAIDLGFTSSNLQFGYAGTSYYTYPFPIGFSAGDFHAYRLTLKNGMANIYIDNNPVVAMNCAAFNSSGKGIFFMDWTGSPGSDSGLHSEMWDYIRYYTGGAIAPSDVTQGQIINSIAWDNAPPCQCVFKPDQTLPEGTAINYFISYSTDNSQYTPFAAMQNNIILPYKYMKIKAVLNTADISLTPVLRGYSVYYPLGGFRSIQAIGDNLPPITTFVPGRPSHFADNGVIWATSRTTFTLDAIDQDGDNPCGVYAAKYRINNGDWNVYAKSFKLKGYEENIPYTIDFYGIDNIGNQEAIKSRTIRLDDDEPQARVDISPPKYITSTGETQVTPGTQVMILASDAGSGIETVQYSVDGGQWVNCTGPFRITQADTHILTWQASDNVENKTSSIQTITVTSKADWDQGQYASTEGQSESGSLKLVSGAVSGLHVSGILDLGEIPAETGALAANYVMPAGTGISFEYSHATVPEISDWKYARIVTVNNPGSTDLSDFQVMITLSPVGFDYSKAKSDGSDIRVMDSDGATPLPYYMDSWNPLGESRIWAKIPSLPASSVKSIYLYYGNSGASSESRGESVFLSIDDFNGNTWQDKWTLSAWPGAPDVIEHDGYLDIPSWYGGGQNLFSSISFLSQPIIIESRMMHFESYESQSVIGLKQGHQLLGFGNNGYEGRGFYLEDYAVRGQGNENWAGGSAFGVWKYYKVLVDGNNFDGWRGDAYNNYDQYIDWDFSNTGWSFNSVGECSPMVQIWRSGMLMDWIRIRKYAGFEPAVQVGAEDAAGDWSAWTAMQPGQTLPSGYRYWRIRATLFSISGSVSPVLNDYTVTFGKGSKLVVENIAPVFTEIKATPSTVTNTQDIQISVKASESLGGMPEVRVVQNGASGTIVVMSSADNMNWTGNYTPLQGYNGQAEIDVKGYDPVGFIGTGKGYFTVSIPSGFALENVTCSPNPFNPKQGRTAISFTIVNASALTETVVIKDDKGALVRTFRMLGGSAGLTRTVIWDGKNASGNTVSEGVYSYTITALSRQTINSQVYFVNAVPKVGQITVLSMIYLDTSSSVATNPESPVLTIIPYTQESAPETGVLIAIKTQGLITIGSVYDLGPHGTLFDPPAMLTLYYNEQDVAGFESGLKIYDYNESTGQWEITPGQILDTVNNCIRVPITHLSLYSLYVSKTEMQVALPVADITQPVQNSFAKGEIEITGTAKGQLFSYYRLEYMTYVGGIWTVIDTIAYEVESGTLAVWNTSGLEGPCTLRLSAKNRAGDISMSLVTLILDNTLPDTTLISIGDPKHKYADTLPVVVTSATPFDFIARDGQIDGIMPSGINRVEYILNRDAFWTTAQNNEFTISESYPDGTYVISYRAVDNAGNTEDSKSVTVVLDNNPPVIQLIYPAKDAIGIGKVINSNTVSIIGVITDINFSDYRIDIQSMGETPFFQTIASQSAVGTGTQVLAVLNRSQLPDGWYLISVTAEDNLYNTSHDVVIVYMGNPEARQVFGSYGNDNGEFKEPYGIAFSPTQNGTDNSGCIFVTDTNNDRVQKFDKKGSFILSFNGRSEESKKLKRPTGITVDPESRCVFVADRDKDRIQAFDLSGNYITTFGENHDIKKPEQLSLGLYYTNSGSSSSCTKAVFVADKNKDSIAVFDYTGNLLLTKDGLKDPEGVFVGSDGSIYIANTGKDSVGVYTSALTPTLSIKGFDNPRGIYADNRGYIYVSDSGHNAVKKFNGYGELLMQWTGACTTALDNPAGICLDNSGNLWIVDQDNNRIMEISRPALPGETQSMRGFSLPQSAMTIKDAYAYPVPYKPSAGHTVVNFKLYSTLNVLFRIYNIAGELVFEQTGITTDPYAWNVLNNYGEPVASGVYIYFLTDDSKEKKLGKVMIIR